LTRIVSDFADTMSKHFPEDKDVDYVRREAAALARQDASVGAGFPVSGMGNALAGLLAGGGPLGIAAAMALKGMMAARRREREAQLLADEAAEMTPEQAKQHLQRRRSPCGKSPLP